MGIPSVTRPPDDIHIQGDSGWQRASHESDQNWSSRMGKVSLSYDDDRLLVFLESPEAAVSRVRLRWKQPLSEEWRVLGDHWERGYGDLEWRGMVPERVMPWYFAVHDDEVTVGIGVETNSCALCFWQIDPGGIALWMDVRCGGCGVELGERALHVSTIVECSGGPPKTPFQVVQELCRQMCHRPIIPDQPVYGGNNWYYAYGRSSHEQILDDSRLIADLAAGISNRPYMVIDDGWQCCHVTSCNGGPWDRGNYLFPDMPGLATEMKELGVRPGIWTRPLLTHEPVPADWLLPTSHPRRRSGHQVLDPSVPGVIDRIEQDVQRIVIWGYELLKHDFTTFDIMGKWGFEMGSKPTDDGWSFADRTRTTAEIITGLYRSIAQAAGSALVIGCNTVGHLAAGLFALQRTGDDTSGRDFERTRKYGVNTLAFRMPQHLAFFASDADCVGLTGKIPWEMNRQWLDLLSRSGTPLFVSADPSAVGPVQRQALKVAFERASNSIPPAEPLDWTGNTCPVSWKTVDGPVRYDWFDSPSAWSALTR